MRQIVCLSTSNWHPYPTRKQQVMGRIHGAEILYFDPPVSMIARFKDKAAKARGVAYKKGGEQIKKGLTVYALPPVLPFFNKYRFINKINQRRQGRYISKIIKKHGFDRPVVWCYSPTAADVVDRIAHSAVVYDCVDRHSAYKGLINPAVVDDMERDLAAKADVVFCTAKGLEQTLSRYNKNTHLIPNGANYELFSRAAQLVDMPFPPPDDMFNIQKPVLGFVGMLQECIDYELLMYAAAAKPDWSFVMVGGVQPDVDITPLKQFKNIHLLGLKPHKELPQYLAYFDACLNLFRSGDLAKDVSPLKFYEYLATGKPVVSTPQPEQVREYSDAVYIAATPQEFVEKCAAAISEKSAWHTQKRMEYGKAASWDARVAAMEKILAKNKIF